jgi:GT2 family glycosyltransferase
MSLNGNLNAALGFVAIGRNEGERLKVCLRSLPSGLPTVYVDSGSTDGSLDFSQSIGVHTVLLDPKVAFTAARARNAGFKKLIEVNPDLEYVQFIDGDCELFQDWIQQALAAISQNAHLAVVAGRRRERFPESSIYNTLIDFEWNSPIGIGTFCGGDALIRRSALEQVGGYREDLIAGEEPELCLRLKNAGWQYSRINVDMTLHDAAIFKFKQWWNRSRRAGFAFAQGAHLHGGKPHYHWKKETRRALFWGAGWPIVTLILTATLGASGLFALLLYALQMAKIAFRLDSPRNGRCWRAVFLVLGKFPEAHGALQFFLANRTQTAVKLIEYK